MGTTRAEIAGWLADAQAKGKSHMIVFCDTFDWTDYPVGVSGFDEYRAALREHVVNGGCMVIEVYDLSMPLDAQQNEWRAHHPPIERQLRETKAQLDEVERQVKRLEGAK